jgi:uncharacterized protein YgiM (DUF1202 family)
MLCGVLLGLLSVPSLWAAEPYTVNSEGAPLNVRSGPGIEYEIVTRLPHGTQVLLEERAGLWAKITPPSGPEDGWVLERYLLPVRSTDATAPVELSPEQERRRFTRLQRKGVITVNLLGEPEVLRLTITPLLWYRLTPQEQQNFLERAKRTLGGTTVEIYDTLTNTLLARLSTTGTFEATVPAPSALSPITTTSSSRSR